MDSRRMRFSSTASPQQPKKKALAVGVPRGENPKCRPSSALQIVALLVLLTRSAITGVVAAELLTRRRAGRRRDARRRGGGASRLAGHLTARLARVGPRRDRRQLHRRVADDLHLEQALDHRALDALKHVLEEIERLFLVLGERVALTVAPQPDAFLEMIDRQQVVLPLRVENDQHLVSLERVEEIEAELALTLREARPDGGLHQLVQPFARSHLGILGRRDARVE